MRRRGVNPTENMKDAHEHKMNSMEKLKLANKKPAATRSGLRNSIIKSALANAIHSNLVLFLLMNIIIIVAIIHFQQSLTLILIPSIFVALKYKVLIFETVLIGNTINMNFGNFPWISGVDNNLYLGGIPIVQMGHRDVLVHKLRISAVLSVVEEFELSCSTIVGEIVNFYDIKQEYGAEFSHLVLPTPDYFPPSFEILEKGSYFINSHLVEGRSVYCHCKSGIV